MAKGGSRPGAGRPRGSRNKATAAKAAEIAASGLTPLDFMLAVLRDESAERDVRLDAASKAAPYVHPKLANVEVKGNQDKPILHRVEVVIVDPPR